MENFAVSVSIHFPIQYKGIHLLLLWFITPHKEYHVSDSVTYTERNQLVLLRVERHGSRRCLYS